MSLPSNMPAAWLAVGLVVLGALVSTARTRTKHRGLPLPPGPRGWPLIGNIHEAIAKGAWVTFTEYKDAYGDLLFFHGLGNNVLVLNSWKAISDLLEKRADKYSHRPEFTVVGELMGLGQSMPLLPYGPEWRAHRRLAHLALSPAAVRKYHRAQEDIAALFFQDVINKPDDFFALMRLTAGRIVLAVTYALPVETADSTYISSAEETMDMIGAATVPGAFLADLIPALKHLPSWLPFRRAGAAGREMIERFVTLPFEHVQRDLAAGTARPSLTADLLAQAPEMAHDPEFLHRVKWTTGAMYGAGGETTYATVLNTIMAMALHPEVQARAQAEIDAVLGPDGLPTVADKDRLPYVSAVIKEVMRWHPTLPLSIARRSAEDDVYEGYYIPKDTIVMPNVWALAFAPDDKYAPAAFLPERFLDPAHGVIDPALWAFGFGRRICPGKALAENSLFVLIGGLLATFAISAPEGGLAPRYQGALVSYPEPFECRIVPRSSDRAELIHRRAAQCEV